MRSPSSSEAKAAGAFEGTPWASGGGESGESGPVSSSSRRRSMLSPCGAGASGREALVAAFAQSAGSPPRWLVGGGGAGGRRLRLGATNPKGTSRAALAAEAAAAESPLVVRMGLVMGAQQASAQLTAPPPARGGGPAPPTTAPAAAAALSPELFRSFCLSICGECSAGEQAQPTWAWGTSGRPSSEVPPQQRRKADARLRPTPVVATAMNAPEA
mmetsp:Transcript_7360/g.16873  ORF Transcript_7360/g.16873 Transcript_7360/m.16873 type:complete len:215 (-) Transcript_7360:185-829(-)